MSPSAVNALHNKAKKALSEAIDNLVKERARLGESLIIWRNGKVAKVPAKQLLKKSLR